MRAIRSVFAVVWVIFCIVIGPVLPRLSTQDELVLLKDGSRKVKKVYLGGSVSPFGNFGGPICEDESELCCSRFRICR